MSSIIYVVLKTFGFGLIFDGVVGHNVLWNSSAPSAPMAWNNTNASGSPKDMLFSSDNNDTHKAGYMDLLTTSSLSPYTETCSLCLKREQVKEQNLLSLKYHILKRLEMQKLPNITIRPNISEKVIHNFYMKHGYRYIRMNETNKKNLFKVSKDNSYYEHYPQQFVSKLKEQETAAPFGEFEYFDEYDYYNRNFEDLQYPNEYNLDSGIDDGDDDIFSKIKKQYVFPENVESHEQGDILQFGLQKSDNHVNSATFNMFINGHDWLEENAGETNKIRQMYGNNGTIKGTDKHISITINSVDYNETSHELSKIRTYSNYVGEISKGQWIRFNITNMFEEWVTQMHCKGRLFNYNIFVKTLHPWIRKLIALNITGPTSPFIELHVAKGMERRSKRHIALNCNENDKNARCCRYPLRVDFRKFGWDWIIAPDIYEAYYCSGECATGFLPKYAHSYLFQLSTSFNPCCSPRRLSPLNLLYFDENKQVIHSIIPNMAVEKCSCS